jgi:hypothetical protein
MKFGSRIGAGVLALTVAGALFAAGCGTAPQEAGNLANTGKDTKHDAWWCEEHGIPEDECSMCSATVAKRCKAKGDWCQKHPDRALSQCFVCNPKRQEYYAAKYRAKYGKEPPPITDDVVLEARKKGAPAKGDGKAGG